ncbi:MAG: hypothetical protein LBF81_06540 [Prevotellaceae bacterium]|jgi:hypothetical protein|nr:hypothetical protein [Prevotellaceae bacterium]
MSYRILIDILSGRPFIFKNAGNDGNDTNSNIDTFTLSNGAVVAVNRPDKTISISSQDGEKDETIIMSDLDNLKIESVLIEI